MKRGFCTRIVWFVVAVVFFSTNFYIRRIMCISQSDVSDANLEEQWTEFYDTLRVYRRVILSGDSQLLYLIPEKIRHVVTRQFLYPRRNASEFFKSTKNRALIGGNLSVLAALEPDELPGKFLNNPAELTVWHNTGHGSGSKISIEDDNGRILADMNMPEISHYQDILYRDKIKMYYAEPTAPEGSVKMYAWSLESSSAPLSAFLEMRVKFANYKSDKWEGINTDVLRSFFTTLRLYQLSFSSDYYQWIHGALPESMPEPKTGRLLYFKKSAREVFGARLMVWRYGPLVAAVEPYNLQNGPLNNPARFEVWHNSGDDVRLAIVISDDKKNILADFEMPHIEGFPAILRHETIEINFKKPSTRAGSVGLYAVFPYPCGTGGKETLKEYPVRFTE